MRPFQLGVSVVVLLYIKRIAQGRLANAEASFSKGCSFSRPHRQRVQSARIRTPSASSTQHPQGSEAVKQFSLLGRRGSFQSANSSAIAALAVQVGAQAQRGLLTTRDLSRSLLTVAYLWRRHAALEAVQLHCLESFHDKLHEAGSHDKADVAWALAKTNALDQSIVNHLVRASEPHFRKFTPGALSKLAWAFAVSDVDVDDAFLSKVAVAAANFADMSPRDLSLTLWSIARHASANFIVPMELMVEVEQKIPQFDPTDLGQLLWAFTRLHEPCARAAQLVAVRCVDRVEEFTMQEISTFAWAFATLGMCEDMHVFTQSASSNLAAFSGRSLANMLWAVARSHGSPAPLFLRQALPHVRLRVGSFSQQHLSNLAWAYATVRIHCETILPVLASYLAQIVDGASPQAVTNMIWAFAKSQTAVPDMLLSCCKWRLANLRSFLPQHLSILAWSLAKLHGSTPELLLSIDHETEARLRSGQTLRTREASNLAWAFAAVSNLPATTVRRYLRSAWLHGDSPTAADLVSLAWCMAHCKVNDDELLAALHMAILDGQGLHELEVTDAALLAWGVAKLAASDHSIFRCILHCVSRKVGDATPRDMATILWSMAALKVESRLWNAVEERATESCIHWCARDLAAVSWAMAKQQYRSQKLLAMVMQKAPGLLRGASAHDLAMLLWGVAALAVHDRSVYASASAVIEGRLSTMDMPHMTMLTWAFATAEWADVALLQKIDAVFRARINHAEQVPAEFAKNILGMAWALSFAGVLSSASLAAAGAALTRLGRVMDGAAECTTLSEMSKAAEPARCLPELPRLILDLPDRCVVLKPVAWEVGEDSAAIVTELPRLQHWMQGMVGTRWRGLPFDSSRCFGFIHRLDVPCSGLLLAAKTYEAYFDLQLQVVVREVVREYVVLSHGWLHHATSLQKPPVRIKTRLHWRQGDTSVPTEVSLQGKPSVTQLTVLAHAFALPIGIACSLVLVQIATGRRHQIRAQTAHIGYPVVCDGKYSSANTYVSDSASLCHRNCLHRSRLVFRDVHGRRHTVDADLPCELLKLIRQLRPRACADAAALLRVLTKAQSFSTPF